MPCPIGLIDANNFYASAERAFDPTLWDRPVVVLSNNDGCVVARSPEAKKIGVPMAVPIFEVRPLIENNRGEILSSNYELYADMSWRFQTVLEDFTPDVEHYSIDEVFVLMPHSRRHSLTEIGQEMREQVRALSGIPVSIGFAETKTLAKIAIEHAKKSAKTNGVLDLTGSPYQDAALERIEVGDVWGVGPRYASMLERNGVRTALDLKHADDDWIRRRMTVVGLRTVQELRGVQCIPFETMPPVKKMLTVSRSFGAATDDLRELRAAVAFFASNVAEKLREHQLLAGKLTVFVSTDAFKNVPQYSNSATLSVAPKSDSTIELLPLALTGLGKVLRDGFLIRKAGVSLDGLELASRASRRLWEVERNELHRRLMDVMDSLNEKFGRDTLRCGLFPSAGIWRTRFEHVSPKYTTDWGQIMTAH